MAALAAELPAAWQPTDSPTGLAQADLQGMTDGDLAALAVWHAGVAGSNDGIPWWPWAVRRLTPDARLQMASDPEVAVAWETREQQRVRVSVEYFVDGYGHVQGNVGDPEPFHLWPEQRQVLVEFERCLRVWVLKARQLGLTWLALHFGFHLQAFHPDTPRARILALSKTGEDASKLLARVRRINMLLPPYLRHVEHVSTRSSKTEFRLEGRGHMVSLMSTPAAARSETATLAIVDEAAFIRNGQAGETIAALGPTLGALGRLFGISSGNGDPDTPGDGQAFAERYVRARSGQQDPDRPDVRVAAVFLPTSVHPDRDDAFYDGIRDDFDSAEDLLREYPETEDQALAGRTGDKVFSVSGVSAAERLGRAYDRMLQEGKLGLPMDDTGEGAAVHGGIDWGLGMSFLLHVWPLESGGVYVPPDCCIASVNGEPGELAQEFFTQFRGLRARLNGDGGKLWLGEGRYDAAGGQSMRTFATAARQPNHLPLWRPDQIPGRGGHRPIFVGVPFGGDMGVKSGKGYKQETVGYLRRLFQRAADGKTAQIIAISPQGEGNQTLLRQLRGLEFKDPSQGRINKVDDHGPDALIAGVAPIAKRWRQAVDSKASA